METEVLAAAQEIDFSLWTLFWRATLIVKVVMLMLIVASVWVWAIYIQNLIQFRRARQGTSDFDEAFWSGQPLDQLYGEIGGKPETANERIFVSAMAEWERSHRQDGGMIAGAMSRIDRAMDVAIAKERERGRLLGFLARFGALNMPLKRSPFNKTVTWRWLPRGLRRRFWRLALGFWPRSRRWYFSTN